jgi:hypothetical protein
VKPQNNIRRLRVSNGDRRSWERRRDQERDRERRVKEYMRKFNQA